MTESRPAMPLTQVLSDGDIPSGPPTARRSVRVRSAPTGEGSSLVDRAYDEYCRLLEQGVEVDPDAFCGRFPAVQSSLGRLLRAHLFLEDNLDLLEDLSLPAWPQVDTAFAGFHLEAELGQGAFARVYRAREIALGNRRVAIKVSPQGGLEAATQGRIQHPNIVPVHSVQEDLGSGLTVICMPYLGRTTLGAALDGLHGEGRVPRRAAEILREAADPLATDLPPAPPFPTRAPFVEGVRWLAWRLADALAHLHRRGIRHRDLKPSNILLRPDGHPLLLDFNLAADAALPDVRQGGTLPYMAPEQLRAAAGLPAQVDERADLYALGVILYETLTGRHPFGPVPLKLSPRDLRAFLVARQEQGFVPLRRLRPEVDRAFARWIEACLAPRPEDRPATAERSAFQLGRDQILRRRVLRFLGRHPVAGAAGLVLATGLTVAAAAVLPRTETPPPALQGPAAARALLAEAARAADPHARLALFDQALSQDPGNLEALEHRARLHQELGAVDPAYLGQAVGDFDRLYRATKAPRYQASKGYCLHLQGQIAAALYCYQKAQEEGFRSPQLLNNYGVLLRVQARDSRQLAEAEKVFRQALADGPELSAVHHNYAVLLFNRFLQGGKQPNLPGKLPESLEAALRHIHRALELDPDSPTLAYRCATIEARAAAHDAARRNTTLSLLEKAVTRGYPPEKLRNDPFFTEFAHEDRFLRLLRNPAPAAALPARFVATLDPVSQSDRP